MENSNEESGGSAGITDLGWMSLRESNPQDGSQRPASPAHLPCSGGHGMLDTMTDYFTRTQEMQKDQIAKMNVIVRGGKK